MRCATVKRIALTARRRRAGLALCAALGLVGLCESALADYGKTPASTVDSAVLKIDEKKYLGVPIAKDYLLQGSDGRELALGDQMDKPLILVLSYYNCDGACPAINESLHIALEGVRNWQLGKDYRVLTLSFDPRDNRDSMNMFVQMSGFHHGIPDGWTVAVLKNADDIARLTGSIGFKYFWEPRDRVFLHPAIYTVISPEARVTRFLYAGAIQSFDLSMSITNAYGNELSASNLVNYLVSACYSYNYHDGKFTLSYPTFIAFGTLGFGMSFLSAGVVMMKRRGKK